MYRHTLIFTVVCSFFVPPALAQAKSDGKTPNSTDAATITVTKLEVSDKTLAVRYEIKNGAQNDAWICESIAQGSSCEVYLDDDDKTLVIRKRLDVPSSTTWMEPPLGKYVRLRPGKKRNESLLLAVPVNSLHVYSPRRGELRGVVNATRLSIEIGYYVNGGPLSGMSGSPVRSCHCQ